MDNLRSQLADAGFDVTSLCPLRDVAVEGDDDLADLELSEVEEAYPIYTLPVPLADALPAWEKLHALADKIGHYPVILGGKQDIGQHWESREDADFPDDYLDASRVIDVLEWFDARFAEDSRFANGQHWGDWPPDARPFFTGFDLSRFYWKQPPSAVYIALLETSLSWQVPAYLAFGCWNDCPCPAQQVTVHHHWQTAYQAEIVLLTSDTLVCRVGLPVTNQYDARELAREHVAYCGDNFNLMKSLDAYAAQLVDSTHWLFWWD